MALNLVDYGSGSDLDEEMDESSPSISVIIPKKTQPIANPYPKEVNEDDADIPMPSQKELELAEIARREKANIAKLNPLSQLAQKKNGKVVIGIPSLADLDDEDIDEKKVKKPTFSTQKGQSQLFTKLPPPKNSRYEPPVEPVLPNLDKPAVPKKSNPLIPQSVAKKQNVKKDSDDEDESGGGSFFTLDEPALKPVAFEPIPAPMVHPVHQGPLEQESSYYPIPTNQDYNMAGMDMAEAGGSGEGQMELDAVALQALQGASGVKRKMTDDMEMIEVRAERLSYDPNMSYLKGISEEKSASSGPDITYNKLQKKKHQITYLAAQAKAREVDLKNQWAQNKSTRRQTQAKYGF